LKNIKKGKLTSKKTLFILLFLIIPSFYFYLSWLLEPAKNNHNTATVRRGDIENAVLATGKIYAIERVNVGAQVTGQVKSLQVKMGDKVVKGQLIAEIDDLQQRNNLRNAEAALKVVQADQLAKQAVLKQARAQFARQQRMLKEDASSREDYENAETTLKTTQAELVALGARLIQAQIEVDKKKLDLSYTKVLAPMDGIVIAVITQQGQTVNASQNAPTIIKLARLDVMTIKAQISEADITRIVPGQKGYFSIFAEPEKRYDATLRAVELAPESVMKDDALPSGSGSGSTNTSVYYDALLDVPNPDNKLRIAMTAQVTLPLNQAKNALLVPVHAVQTVEGKSKVQLIDKKQQITVREVKTGISNNVDIEITEGLNVGDVLIVDQTDSNGATKQESIFQ